MNIGGSYFRVKARISTITHNGLRVCPKVTPQHLAEMKREVEETENKVKMNRPKKGDTNEGKVDEIEVDN